MPEGFDQTPVSDDTFDHTHRRYVSYIDKSREYYLSKGYGNPYRWASHEETPFTTLAKSLSQVRLGLVTTAALNEEDSKSRPLYAARTHPAPKSLYTYHMSWHKTATHTNDLDSFFPINRVNNYIQEGRIGSLSPRFYGLPTKYSQSQTRTVHAPAILDFCREDGVDAVLLSAL